MKNLPPRATEKTLSELFAQCGEVTDARLIRTRAGLSRRFGFVGLASDSQAQRAVETFDRSFIGSTRISVEVAKPYGDESLQRPWSKYSKGSSAFAKRDSVKKMREGEKEDGRGEKSGVKSAVISELGDIEEEGEFHEFLSVHTHKSQVKTWGDGSTETREKRKTTKKKQEKGEEVEEGVGTEGRKRRKKSQLGMNTKKQKFVESCQMIDGSAGESASEEDVEDEEKDEEENEVEEEGEEEEEEEEDEEDNHKGNSRQSDEPEMTSSTQSMTDFDYLRSKIVTELPSASEDDDDEVASDDSGEESESTDEESTSKEEEAPTNQSLNEFSSTLFTLRMRGLPFRSKREDVETFFHPLPLADVRFTIDKDGRPSGRAYVDFNSEEDMNEALMRNGDCIGKRYIELFHDEGPQSARREGESENKREFGGRRNDGDEYDETIADSGRLFLRNLSFTVKEEDLTETFEQFGPLTEVTVPLDKSTNRPTGLGFVTFMLPEHAVKAYEAMDGQVYQGRLLHILPGRQRRTRVKEEDEEGGGAGKSGSSFKKKKEKELKLQSGSSHNWNALFLGANSVVDAMSRRYSTPKSSILDPESEHSAAVRMALGETQLVSETREFLEAEGVRLDVFEKKNPKRSSTVILVKNLPHGTKQNELQDIFSPFGSLHKVILPPAGVSALVEFLESSHAKAAFKRLAYSKFKHLPLYLEWAPVGAMGEGRKKRRKKKDEEGEDEGVEGEGSEGNEKGEGKEEKEEEEEEMEEGCTLFVKNLNFSSDEKGLRNVFSRAEGLTKVEVARKRNVKDLSHPLSMGFGFVQFSTPQQAQQALKDLQHTELDGHRLELKLSHRSTAAPGDKSGRKTAKKGEQKSAKIMVRNIPFEATQKEVRQLFQTFGQLKTVRLPKKMASMGRHRGFGFVEFMTREDARRAFDSLCYSTHLYGRRLVLEWAEGDESVEEIRKRTADHFHGLTGAASSKRRKAEFLLYGNSRDKDID